MTIEQINEQLSTVMYPGFTKDIVTFGFVKNVNIDGSNVTVTLDITSSAPEVSAQLSDEITKKLSMIGATAIVDVKAPVMPRETSSKGKNIAPQIKNFVMVSSGKGGVGKSTTSVNLAIATAQQGKKVGLLDADIYGPNIPRMMGLVGEQPQIEGNKAIPLEKYGIEVMSMGSLIEEGQSLIWRGAMIMKAITQFFQDIKWGELDILFIDMPPGTGDAQLSLAQSVPVTAGVMVSTPQTVALDDAARGMDMFDKLNIPHAGIVENMSGFICPDTNKEYDIFGKGTTEPMAQKYGTKVIAEIPIEPAIRKGGDNGEPITFANPSSESAKRYMNAAEIIIARVDEINEQELAGNEGIQPTMGVNGAPSACSTGATQAQPQQSSGGSCGTGCGCH
jgi:ATP-binding protein involved in chromosome partitioning